MASQEIHWRDLFGSHRQADHLSSSWCISNPAVKSKNTVTAFLPCLESDSLLPTHSCRPTRRDKATVSSVQSLQKQYEYALQKTKKADCSMQITLTITLRKYHWENQKGSAVEQWKGKYARLKADLKALTQDHPHPMQGPTDHTILQRTKQAGIYGRMLTDMQATWTHYSTLLSSFFSADLKGFLWHTLLYNPIKQNAWILNCRFFCFT